MKLSLLFVRIHKSLKPNSRLDLKSSSEYRISALLIQFERNVCTSS